MPHCFADWLQFLQALPRRHDAKGFLVNKIYLPGAVLCSGRLTTLWAVQGFSSIDRESLSILMLMRPPPGDFGFDRNTNLDLPCHRLNCWSTL